MCATRRLQRFGSKNKGAEVERALRKHNTTTWERIEFLECGGMARKPEKKRGLNKKEVMVGNAKLLKGLYFWGGSNW